MTQNFDFSARDARAAVDRVFVERWSPRAFTDSPVSDEDLATVIDAARFSPSAFNEQPWRFWTSTPATHGQFVDLLVEGNQVWARHAPVIGVIGTVLQHAHDGSDNGWAVFDAGAAWMAMTLQARMLGLYTHGMAGVHFDAAYEALGIDRETTQVVCAFALGHVGEAGSLPEALAEREAPSPRKSLESIWTPVTV